jgi:hypothetical protein
MAIARASRPNKQRAFKPRIHLAFFRIHLAVERWRLELALPSAAPSPKALDDGPSGAVHESTLWLGRGTG